MSIGNIIKYHRVEKKLTQSQLCKGICSVTHLSKIENNNKEADPETISLLLNRLGLSLKETEQLNAALDLKLSLFFKDIIFYDKGTATVKYHQIIEDSEKFMISKNVYIYHLYIYRYLLFLGLTKEAANKKRTLDQFSSSFSQHENHLFKYFNAILLIQQGQYPHSLQILNSLEEDIPLPYFLEGEFNYQIALAYSNLKDSNSCISYAQKAIKHFRNQYNFIRILHAQILLAIHCTESGLFHEALEHFSHLLRNVNLIQGTELKATIHHNYAIFCEKQSDLDKALEHYLIAQNNAYNTYQYYMSLCNLTEILIAKGNKENALENIAEILKNTNTKPMKKYYPIFKYYKFMLLEEQSNAFRFLENQVLPYLEKNKLIKDLQKFSLILGEYYSTSNKDKAIYYYKKVGV